MAQHPALNQIHDLFGKGDCKYKCYISRHASNAYNNVNIQFSINYMSLWNFPL